MKFIQLKVRSGLVHHGFDTQNHEVLEETTGESFVPKLISIERILSATERYLLVTGPFGRQLYWEYEGGLDALTERLTRAGLTIDSAES